MNQDDNRNNLSLKYSEWDFFLLALILRQSNCQPNSSTLAPAQGNII